MNNIKCQIVYLLIVLVLVENNFFFRNENLLKVKEFKKNKLLSGDLKTI